MFEPENVTKEQFLTYLENGIDSLEILVTHKDNGAYKRNGYFNIIKLNSHPAAYLSYEYYCDYYENGNLNSVFEEGWKRRNVKFHIDMKKLVEKIYAFAKKAKKDKSFKEISYWLDDAGYINLVE